MNTPFAEAEKPYFFPDPSYIDVWNVHAPAARDFRSELLQLRQSNLHDLVGESTLHLTPEQHLVLVLRLKAKGLQNLLAKKYDSHLDVSRYAAGDFALTPIAGAEFFAAPLRDSQAALFFVPTTEHLAVIDSEFELNTYNQFLVGLYRYIAQTLFPETDAISPARMMLAQKIESLQLVAEDGLLIEGIKALLAEPQIAQITSLLMTLSRQEFQLLVSHNFNIEVYRGSIARTEKIMFPPTPIETKNSVARRSIETDSIWNFFSDLAWYVKSVAHPALLTILDFRGKRKRRENSSEAQLDPEIADFLITSGILADDEVDSERLREVQAVLQAYDQQNQRLELKDLLSGGDSPILEITDEKRKNDSDSDSQ